jgi:WD40 repeat protein/energy-coupling factor transporter ATP-binding protein EcfA2
MITDHIYKAEVEVPLNPFPGLRPFEFHESNLYFGRDGQSERMLSKLSARHFVAVVGTSGSGKSSLVRAGLLPALFGGFMTSAGSNWRVALMRPGNDPLGNLARALNHPTVFGSDIEENAQLQTTITEATLRRGSLGLVEAVRQTRMPSNENLLIVVDQFEELFRFARMAESEQYQNEAAAFVKLLLGAIKQREAPIFVVITLRSDYLGDCALFWDLPEAVNESQFLIPRLTREQRREAITGPVAVCGGEIAPRLVNRLLNDVGDDQDQLPILQHALMRAWDCWRADHAEGEPIDLRHYESIGGMSDALSRHADEAYAELPDERSRAVAEKLFKGLTEKGADNREIRRPLELHEICALTEATEEEVVAVVEPFRREGRSFLMPPAAAPLNAHSVVDISHESLIRCWQRLHDWVEDETRSARIYGRLAETAALYERGEAGLWRDPELQLALNWREDANPNEAWARRYHAGFAAALSFLEESRAARDREVREREQARRRELRRTRAAAAVLLLLLLCSLGLAAYARGKQQEALFKSQQLELKTAQLERQTRIAEEEKGNATYHAEQAFAAKKRAEDNLDAAERAREATLEQKQKADEQARIAHENEVKAVRAKAEAERQRQAALVQEKAAHEAERQAVAEAARANQEAERANNLLYAADINLAQQSFGLGDVERAQELLDTFLPKPEQKELRGFEWYYLWQLYHKERETLEAHSEAVASVAYSPDGRSIATASVDGKVVVWDAVSRRETATPNWGAHPVNAVNAIAYSPDSRWLAIAAGDNTIRLWDRNAPHAEASVLHGATTPLHAVAFSPDGRRLAAGSEDKNVFVWNLSAPTAAPAVLKGHEQIVRAVAFSPDGRLLASAGKDVKLWDMNAPEPRALTLDAHRQPVVALSFSPDGSLLATGSEDARIGLWNVRTPTSPPVMLEDHERAVTAVAFSPDGKTLGSGSEDNTVRLWDTTLPEAKPITLGSHREIVSSLAFSRDGRVLVSGGYDKKVKLWDIASQHGLATLRGIGASVGTLAYTPDGRRLATGNVDGEVKIWEAASRRELAAFKAHTQAIRSLAISPDGRHLVTAGSDAAVKLWDLDAPARPPVVLRGGFTRAVYAVAFSPDGTRLAAAGDDKIVKVWNLAAPASEPLALSGHADAVTSLAYTPDGRALVSAGLDGTLRLWDLSDARTQPVTFAMPEGEDIWAVAVSPDGRRIATGGQRVVGNDKDYRVKVWDAQTRELLGVLKGHAEAVRTIAFSPDGRTIATGSVDKTVRLWSAVSFQELATLKGHRAAVYAVAFSPLDGRTLASASFDWYVKLWYAATDEEVAAKK